MPPNSASIQGLDEVRELNRVFLNYVRRRLEAGRRMPGLPSTAARALARAPTDAVDALANLPQAMFRFDLEELERATVRDPAAVEADSDRRMLNEFLLVSAWNVSRHSYYAARLFLRLTDGEVRLFRSMPLGELAVLARYEHLVRCAYREVSWLWCELVTADRPEQHRRLVLLALQPRFELNRPVTLMA